MRKYIGLAVMALSLVGCATEAQLRGIASRAKIPQECSFVGTTPEISDLGTKKNLSNITSAMGGGNIIIVTGRRVYGGLAALANTWWGDLYACDIPTQYQGTGIVAVQEKRSYEDQPGFVGPKQIK
jgi:outer membrane lipoprotein SlyB